MIADPGIKRVALYTRVSTEEQAEHGFSLDSQLERLRAFCFSKELTIVGEYIDAGASGRNIKRPEYQHMMADHEKWDVIVVIKMDRIHRNRLNFIQMMSDLAKENKEFISMSESLDTSTAMGRFVAGIIQDIAQLESEQLGERTFLGMKQKAKASVGVFNGHFRPYGYKIEDHQLIPEPDKLAIVKKAFELYDQGTRINNLAKITGLKYCTLQYILHNSIYAGFEQWCYIFKRANIEPVISIELFNRVQQSMIDFCPNAIKRGLEPLQLENLDSWEIPLKDRARMSMLKCRMPKHKMNY